MELLKVERALFLGASIRRGHRQPEKLQALVNGALAKEGGAIISAGDLISVADDPPPKVTPSVPLELSSGTERHAMVPAELQKVPPVPARPQQALRDSSKP